MQALARGHTIVPKVTIFVNPPIEIVNGDFRESFKQCLLPALMNFTFHSRPFRQSITRLSSFLDRHSYRLVLAKYPHNINKYEDTKSTTLVGKNHRQFLRHISTFIKSACSRRKGRIFNMVITKHSSIDCYPLG